MTAIYRCIMKVKFDITDTMWRYLRSIQACNKLVWEKTWDKNCDECAFNHDRTEMNVVLRVLADNMQNVSKKEYRRLCKEAR
jgi:hypothetical protein